MTGEVEFFCLCMSPAVDATVTLASAPRGEGEIFKDVREELNFGGKTVNVARYLALRGARAYAGGLLGEENAAGFVRELAGCGVADRFLRVPGATRLNEMIVWPGGSVKLNRPAFPALGADSAEAKPETALSRLLPADASRGVVVISGSLPQRFDSGFYAGAVEYCRALGFTTVLDASGEAMRLGLEAGPDLIKPNAEECAPLVGFVPSTPADFMRATEMLRRKAKSVIISDGASGAWFDGVFAAAPEVEVVDTTAAGDTLLAEFCYRRFALGDAAGEAAAWAVAAGSAACTMPGGAPPPAEAVARLRKGGR